MDRWEPGADLCVLKQRAEVLRKIRRFFEERRLLEVETPLISRFPAVDQHLEAFKVISEPGAPPRFLITSPEYHMKRLLAAGVESIFQLTKAFRRDEAGSHHNPEFTILEWYRKGWDHWQLMDEIDGLLQTLLHTPPAEYLSYCDAFQRILGIDPLQLSLEAFLAVCEQFDLKPPQVLTTKEADRDERLNLLLGMLIEPHLGMERPLFLHDYPASQANLARLYPERPELAMRFEVYYKGIELGNGFCELTDADFQEQRFHLENAARVRAGKEKLAIDHRFLNALQAGMPDCAGVAMGVDRIVMLCLGMENVDQVTAFSWPRA